MNPGAAIPLPAPERPTRDDHAAVDLHVARDERAVHQRRFDAQPHPFTAPAVRAVIRCLRASTNTTATGSV